MKAGERRWGRAIARWLAGGGLAVVAGHIFAMDWLSAHPWWSTWVAMAIFIAYCAYAKPLAALAFSLLFGGMAMHGSFFWAEQMLAYSLDQEGWIPRLVYGLLIAGEMIPIAVFGWLIAYLRAIRTDAIGLWIPFSFWILVEAVWPRVFAWTLGHAQQGWPRLVQIADLGGASLISWSVLWGAALPVLVVDAFLHQPQEDKRRSRSRVAMGVVGLLFAVILLYGNQQLGRWDRADFAADPFRIGIVQEDPSYVDATVKMRSTSDKLAKPLDLVAWPESTLGAVSTELDHFRDETRYRRQALPPWVDIKPLVGLDSPLLVGGRSVEGPVEESKPQRQSALVLLPDGAVHATYHKRRLMPLGEYVPFEQHWPWLHDWFQLNEIILPGTSDEPLSLPDGTRVGVLICFEDIIPAVSRNTIRKGGELLVCIINASAFENPIALRQHLLLAQLRSIENRRYLVRVAGTGVSCVINPAGRIEREIAPYATDAFVATTYRLHTMTWYTRLGNLTPWVALFSMVIAWRPFRRRASA